ncbi:hypothetical protein [Agarivorans sp. Alg241-V36]|uniref:hypothetical protein n=1 Tax=Agarivorans sp. Alg241-V36 TaxID=2305992 RepID=UPI0013CFC6C7|nr:hypothetical protein [Agarivorans sp. Alg241-V36]
MKKITIALTGFAVLSCSYVAAADIRSVQFPNQKLKDKQSSEACPDNVCPGLGNAFYLPSINTLSLLKGGKVFFKDTKLGTCASVSAVQQASREIATYESMEKMVNKVMTSADLSGSYNTAVLSAKGSVNAMTGSDSTLSSSFHSSILDVTLVKSSIDFIHDTNCFGLENIEPSYLDDIGSLPMIEAKNVGDPNIWGQYLSFMQSVGSHIMMQQMIGSRFQQWESSESQSSDIQNTLSAKACADVEGVSAGGGWSVNSCGAYSKDEKEAAVKQQATTKHVIFGGSDEARANMLKEVSKETLDAFIDSADKGTQAVRYTFKPIWELLMEVYRSQCEKRGKGSKACDNLQRAFNLQATYDGWTAIGCEQRKSSSGAIYQQMVIVSTVDGLQTYGCEAPKTGCRNDDSCHIGGTFGTQCYCYGPDCLDRGDQVPFTKNFRDKVVGSKSGSYNQGVNNSCYYKFGAYCDCDAKWAGGEPYRYLYLQGRPSED